MDMSQLLQMLGLGGQGGAASDPGMTGMPTMGPATGGINDMGGSIPGGMPGAQNGIPTQTTESLKMYSDEQLRGMLKEAGVNMPNMQQPRAQGAEGLGGLMGMATAGIKNEKPPMQEYLHPYIRSLMGQ